MKALLLGINSKYIHPALALYQLRKNTTASCELIEVTIKDSNESILSKIRDYIVNSDVIACSCYLWNIEKYVSLFESFKNMNPNIKILLGGPEVAYNSKDVLTNYSLVDYVLTGEGEDSFEEFNKYIDGLLPIDKVSNLFYRNNDNIEFTYNAYPDLNKIKLATLDVTDYKNRIIYLESSRGCPYHCSYCTASLDNNVRYFPHNDIITILGQLMQAKTPVVKFLDRTFNANYKYMMDILEYINENNICTVFQFEVVGEKLKPQTIEAINNLKAKWLRFEIGIQSTNDMVNLSVARKQDFEKLKENILLLNQTNKVDIHADLIAGLPYETKESFISSFDNAFSLKPKELQLGFLKFLKGTKMLEMVEEHEYIYTSNAPYEIIQNKYMSKEDLYEIHKVEKSLNRYYNSGICPNLFSYLWENNLVSSFYNFFLELYIDIEHYQKDDLFKNIDLYCMNKYPNHYKNIHYLLICDYLKNFKVRPKIWWEKQKPFNRDLVYDTLCDKYPSLNKELLYRYSYTYYLEKENYTEYFIIIFKDFINKVYKISM